VVKKLLTHPLLWLLVLGLFLRFYRLDTFPAGFHVDEVKAGWNAYSLFKTGRDDWLHAFPLHYDTFGDQRPTGFFYAAVPAVAAFGLNEFAVRFTPALFGSLGIVGIFFFALFLTKNRQLSLFSAFMFAISPWQISLSRASSEGVISSTLIILGLALLLKKRSLLALVFLCLSFLFYHTARILVPLFVLAILGCQFFTYSKVKLSAVAVFVITFFLTVAFTLSPQAKGRLSQVSIFTDYDTKIEQDRLPFEEGPGHAFLARALHNKVVLYTTKAISEYSQYIGGKFFLAPFEAKPARYQTAMRSLVLYSEFALFAAGLVYLLTKKVSPLPLVLLLLAPLPAAITIEDSPNLHRAFLMSPFFSLIAGLGLFFIKKQFKLIFLLVLLFLILDFSHYTHMYLVHNPGRDSLTITRNTGAKELIAAISALPSDKNIYLTNRPDHLYPYFAFYTSQDPKLFNPQIAPNKSTAWKFNHIIFSQFRCPSQIIKDQKQVGSIAVDAEGCTDLSGLTKITEIKRGGGGIPYTIWTYNP